MRSSRESPEATAVLLTEPINRITDDRDFATRLIAEALTKSDHDWQRTPSGRPAACATA
ncbi:hypothetical protein [Streptomyces griseoluteus]|uniref:hypothetical protein n=1 Tax=Streptomyces griseoluteus TaxID=29306 RepID=UPI0036F7AF7C